MNKILKIIVKHDPIFKYVVEDYPFYEGLFFHLVDFHNMNILNAHYLLRQRLSINSGKPDFFYISKYIIHLTPQFYVSPAEFLTKPKFRIKFKTKFYILNTSKIHARSKLRLKMHDKNYSKSTVNLHMIKLTKLQTHDPYTLENRDTLTLADMDGEKIL